jgi:hypothetical protein
MYGSPLDGTAARAEWRGDRLLPHVEMVRVVVACMLTWGLEGVTCSHLMQMTVMRTRICA